jgi:hypothetical protein
MIGRHYGVTSQTNTRRGRYKRSMSEQAQEVSNEAIPQWAEGLYFAQGRFSEAVVYRDDEALYFEHRGPDSGIVRFPLEMLQTLTTTIEANEELPPQ